MEDPYQGSPDVHVLPTSLALPGAGVLPINAYVLPAEQRCWSTPALGSTATSSSMP